MMRFFYWLLHILTILALGAFLVDASLASRFFWSPMLIAILLTVGLVGLLWLALLIAHLTHTERWPRSRLVRHASVAPLALVATVVLWFQAIPLTARVWLVRDELDRFAEAILANDISVTRENLRIGGLEIFRVDNSSDSVYLETRPPVAGPGAGLLYLPIPPARSAHDLQLRHLTGHWYLTWY